MDRKAQVAAWQSRLEDTFTFEGVVGGDLLPGVIDAENECGKEYVTILHGHRILIDSFHDFFATTLRTAVEELNQRGWPKEAPSYSFLLLSLHTQFRGIRGAERLALAGYAMDGYALQRNLMEQAMALGAVASGMTSFLALQGTEGIDLKSHPEQFSVARRRRRKEELRIQTEMMGRDSGLASNHIDELARWEMLFDLQVHGSRLTSAVESGQWFTNPGEPFRFGPKFDANRYGMYTNRSAEIGWMTLRVLPFLQLAGREFDAQWDNKWTVLDDSFRGAVEGLSLLGKKIADSITALVDAKFPFSPKQTRYIER